MTGARIRALLAVTAVTAVLAYSLSGHGAPQMSHDGMAGTAAGLCVLLVTFVGYATAPKRQLRHAFVVTHVEPVSSGPTPRAADDRRARASPISLQRFRN
jgi:hypothetical protein